MLNRLFRNKSIKNMALARLNLGVRRFLLISLLRNGGVKDVKELENPGMAGKAGRPSLKRGIVSADQAVAGYSFAGTLP
jgi:hypothetical protein